MDRLTKRIRGRISEGNWIRLTAASKSKDNSISKILDRALSAFFSFEVDDERDAQIIERLQMLQRHYHRQSNDLHLLTESFSLFLQYYFTLAPRINPADKAARVAQGNIDLNQFIDALGARMKKKSRTFKDSLSDVLISDEDFFKLEELELLRLLNNKKTAPIKKETEDA